MDESSEFNIFLKKPRYRVMKFSEGCRVYDFLHFDLVRDGSEYFVGHLHAAQTESSNLNAAFLSEMAGG